MAIATIGRHFVMERLLIVNILSGYGNGRSVHDTQSHTQVRVTYESLRLTKQG